MQNNDTHSKTIGYILWLFGFMGAHRFYYGKQVTGTIWFFTLGLFFIGWIVDLFLIPGMDREADRKYHAGRINYSVAWLLLVIVPINLLGLHRIYMGKIVSGLLWFVFGMMTLGGALTGPLWFVLAIPFFAFLLYDYLTLNGQIDEINRQV